MIAKLKYNPLLILPSLIIIAVMGLFLTNCKKIEPERIIIVATSSFEELTLNSCKVNGSLLDLGENGVSEHGFYLSLSSNLSEAMSPLTLGKATHRGEFSKIAEELGRPIFITNPGINVSSISIDKLIEMKKELESK